MVLEEISCQFACYPGGNNNQINISNNKQAAMHGSYGHKGNSNGNSHNNNNAHMDYKNIGRTVKTALLKAQAESRVIVGLSAAINVLSKAPEGSLFCLMAEPQAGDSATHMHEVLLEAFCYENDIYVIKVDCPTKLSRILGKTTLESCCLVQKTWTGAPLTSSSSSSSSSPSSTASPASSDDEDELLNKSETILVDYCEAFWDSPQHPVVELPPV